MANNLLNLIHPDYQKRSIEELKELSTASSVQIQSQMVHLEMLGNLFAAATQDENLGYFDKQNQELFGYFLSDLSHSMQAAFELKQCADFHLLNRIQNGVAE